MAQSEDDSDPPGGRRGREGAAGQRRCRNKIREGFAKGHNPRQIEAASSIRCVRTWRPRTGSFVRSSLVRPLAARESAVTLLADALVSGLTTDEVRELQRQAPTASSQDLAGAAKGLSFIKEARLPVTEGTAVMAEAVRQKFRSYEMLDLGREVKRREVGLPRRPCRACGRCATPSPAARVPRRFCATAAPSARAATRTRPEATSDRPSGPRSTDRPQRPVDRPTTGGDDGKRYPRERRLRRERFHRRNGGNEGERSSFS